MHNLMSIDMDRRWEIEPQGDGMICMATAEFVSLFCAGDAMSLMTSTSTQRQPSVLGSRVSVAVTWPSAGSGQTLAGLLSTLGTDGSELGVATKMFSCFPGSQSPY